jgi:CTP:molybdopterin cytidylyltransferase MocA
VIAAVVLAAGASTRYGTSPPKQQVLLPAVLDAVARSAVDDVVVVAGAHPLDVETVACPDWELGPGASLRCGLRSLPPEAEAAVVVLADGPELDPRAVDRVLGHPGPVVAASYDGTRSHPVALARSAWSRIPDEGGRALEPVLVDCSDLRPPGDVDVKPS